MASQANLKSHDWYEVLAVASNATQTEINKAYRRLAQKHHPDKNLTRKEDAEEEFKCIVQAYAVLSDPEQRKRFDQLGQRFLQPSFQVPEDWEERQEVAKAKAKAEREVRDIRTKAAAQVALERKEKMQAKLAEDQARKQEKKALQKAKEEEQKIRSRNSMAKQTARSMQRQSMSAKAKKSKPEAPDPLSEASEPKPGNQAEGPPAAFTEATNAEAALPVQVVAEPFGLGDAIPDQKDFWQELMEACWSRLACCGARRH